MNTLAHLIGIGVAGGIGTLARYGVSLAAMSLLGTQFPWGTLFVNLFGCFLFGILSGLLTAGMVPAAWKIYVLTGVLGGFTTFSAFAYENQVLFSEGHWCQAAVNLIIQNSLGIVAVLLGLYGATLFAARP